MNVLCLDHVCHRKTKSFDFFVEVLRSTGLPVEVFYYDRHYCVNPPDEKVRWADVIVYFEFLPSRFRLIYPRKRMVFLPMYDNEWGSKWLWRRIAWSGMGVISFCGKVTEHARICGVRNILDVRFFPDPNDFPHIVGNPKRVFLWERGDIDQAIAEQLFPPSEGYVFDIKKSNEFLERNAYLDRLSKCGIVLAPRRKEGIGMVFLEAMTMGKCIVACNDATMNEYIKDGENGILFSPHDVRPIDATKVLRVADNAGNSSARFRARWIEDAGKINQFIAKQAPCCPSLGDKTKMTLSYLFYLAEGTLYKLREALLHGKRN